MNENNSETTSARSVFASERTDAVADNAGDKLSFWALLMGVFLTPFFFIPGGIVPLQSAKSYLIFFAVIVAVAAWIIARLKDGRLTLPRSRIYLFFLAIPIWFLISAFFSPVRINSLIGEASEIGTFGFVLALFALAFVVSMLFRGTRQSAYAYLTFFISFLIVALFQFIHLFSPQTFSFGLFTSVASSIVGSWNDLGIYFGSVALFAFITLELLALEAKYKYLFTVIMIISLFMLSVVDFSMVWYVLAASAVIFFVYNFSFKKAATGISTDGSATDPARNRSLPWASLIIFIISILFILVKSNIYTTLANPPFNMNVLGHFSVATTEARPSLSATMGVAGTALKSRWAVGIGPNRFGTEWSIARPVGVNSTPFWSTIFNYGYGLIPTFLVTTGPIGFLLWLGFFAMFVWLGFRSLFTKKDNVFAEYLTVSSFIIALYFWIFLFIYVPSSALLFLTFFFTGLFLGSIADTSLVRFVTFDFTANPKASFVSVLVFVMLLLVGLLSIYGVTRRFISVVYYNAALVSAGRGDISGAHVSLARAIQFSTDPVYYRTLAQLDLATIQQLLASGQPQQAIVSQFQQLLAEAQAAGLAARTLDPTDYQNWLVLGQVADSVVPLNVSGAYDTAKTNYQQAMVLDPNDPSIPLAMARLDINHSDPKAAIADIGQALNLKNDYTDAIFLLAQIQVNQGDTASAIKSLQNATLVSPNDPGLRFNLGLLYYDSKDWADAAAVFQQALALESDYANAKYFLGLALAKQGNTDAALAQFQDLAKTNANNANITTIISNLQAGKDPLAGLTPPANTPEKATHPPVKDKTTGSTITNPTTSTSRQ